MRTLHYTDADYSVQLKQLNRRFLSTPEVQSTVQSILAEIEQEGDLALLKFCEQFGGPRLGADQLLVTSQEIATAVSQLSPIQSQAIQAAQANVQAFARQSLRQNWSMQNAQGVRIGERFDPLTRVGIYVPGGTAPLVSTAIMTCTLAAVAGVSEIVVVTPANGAGAVTSELLAALAMCGATEIYRVGGAQAIAALAFGTATLPAVTKIFGPGNAYVTEAKRQVFGRVAIDLLPGPSEILILADETAHPEWVAADLLAQSEHGHGSCAVLLTPSAFFLEQVQAAVLRQLEQAARAEFLHQALSNAVLIQVKDSDEAIRVANDFAAEHVSLAVKDPEAWAGQLTSAGAIYLGHDSPVVGGDFLAGPSHELPTGGAGKSFAGLTVDQFQRRTSLIQFDRPSLQASLPYIQTLSDMEGLEAHGRSAAIRLEERKGR